MLISRIIKFDYKSVKMVMIRRAVTSRLPTDYGEFQLHAYLEERDSNQDRVHLALVKGVVETGPPPLVRVHSECLTGEVLFSSRCD